MNNIFFVIEIIHIR